MAASSRPQPRRGPSGAWSRLKPANIDPLDFYGLPSKGEVRLHDFKNQEKFHNKIVERYMKLCASASGGDGLEKAFANVSLDDMSSAAPGQTTSSQPGNNRPSLPRQVSATERPNDMSMIIQAMRKLREGIRGSRRRDSFAQRAYVFIIHATILTRHWESYHPALTYLLEDIHPHTPLPPAELQEFVGYRILDLVCRQGELSDALATRFAYKHTNRRVIATLHAVIHDDWVRFWRIKRAVDGYHRAIMEFAVDGMRLHALKCLGRSYMNVDKSFVERTADASWPELVKNGVGWQLQESGNVMIRKPKTK